MVETPSPPRRFQRLRPEADPGAGVETVPKDGMCLSVFLLLEPTGRTGEVLLGRVDPDQPWERLGGLTATRVAAVGERWMLPSSHLLAYEAPGAAAERIATEQLEAPGLRLRGPQVHSETEQRPGRSPEELHWDLHFLFEGEWPRDRPAHAHPFRELRFFPPAELATLDIARGGADILRLAGRLP
ncbi:MAG: NUDIX hydrolase [Thermoplasmata archaeon]